MKRRRDYDFSFRADEEDPRERASGNSWLSNATIASQLSEARIEQAISALKAQITVLEAELLSRRLANSHTNYKDWDEIGDLRGPEDGERLYPRVNRKRNRDRKHKTLQKVASLRKTLKKLGIKDVDSLLAEWSKIVETEKG